ncbi:zinc finger protein 691 isoform X1 [Macaca fascicularis]|uniref:zinc finger protein 691 isoform X1 n=3 Tax=Macaca fascicularis TaxID=9541 RepID=UPI0032B0830E
MCHSCNPALNVVSTSFFILCFFPEILADLKELSVFHFLSSVSCDSLCFPPSSLCSCHSVHQPTLLKCRYFFKAWRKCYHSHQSDIKKSDIIQMAQISSGGGGQSRYLLFALGSEMGSEKEQSPEPHLPEEGEGGKPWRVDDSEGSWIPPGEKEHGQESLSDELQETHPKKPWQKVTVPAQEPGDPIAHPRHEADEKPFICAQCGKTFNNTSNLRTHQRIHTGEKPYKCSECGKSFSRSSNRIRHERIHLEEKHYKCPKCQESFRRRSDLTTHQQDHLGKRPYRCDICGKSFSQSATLAVHHRTHLEPAPYICCECGKSFSNSSSFGVHHRTHTGERPYECTECGRTFSDISNFGAHQRTHRGEKPYRCTVCGKHFSRSSNLIRHQKTHLGEQAGKDSS